MAQNRRARSERWVWLPVMFHFGPHPQEVLNPCFVKNIPEWILLSTALDLLKFPAFAADRYPGLDRSPDKIINLWAAAL